MFNNAERILVVAAHPDDEVLGCGGSLARARDLGIDVAVMFLGEGVSARFPLGEYSSDDFYTQSSIRDNGMKKALDVLGLKLVDYQRNWCTQFDTLPLLKLVKNIESVIQEYKPTTILTHSPSEVNIDHKITYEAVEVACRPALGKSSISIYSFEVVCSGSFKFKSTFSPNYFVNIMDYWDKKIKAWHEYAGETREFPFPRSDKGLEVLSNYRGMQVGLIQVEAYELCRAIV